MDKRKELLTGIKDAVPIVLGYFPLGFAFGVLANSDAGMSVGEATLMSVMCFTGAGQYIAVGLLKEGAAAITIILANLLVNLRYFLFATSLVPFLKTVPTRIATLLSYGLTDETYAVSVAHYARFPATSYYLAGLNLTSHVGWIASSALGACMGQLVADTGRYGLDFALPAMYAVLLVMVVKRKQDAVVAAVTAAVCLLIAYLVPATMNNLSNVIVATLLGATLGVTLKK
ncbi:MAG: AzlC family ABC transporter permease [Syntrophomonadaceae bacterium]|nr:AzlC family ABC transporter permease [Syntrophomonadaceae bacterium]